VTPMLPARFWAKVRQDGDCWLWTAAKTRDGYGIFLLNGKTNSTVHRLTFEELRGEIPVGLVIDHLCRTRACVNPWHMEPVTNQKNTERGLVSATNSRRNANGNRCRAGLHDWTEGNILVEPSGKRRCRPCRRAYRRTGR